MLGFTSMRVALFDLRLATIGFAAACSGADPITPPPPPPLPPPSVSLYRLATAALPAAVLQGRSMEARAADLDADGDKDLIIAREFEPNLLFLNDGTGRFVDVSSGQLPQKTRDSEDIAIADFDGDGDLDVVIVAEDDVPGSSGPKHEYYLNNGRAVFTDVSERLALRTETNAVAFGDLDGDGDLDLVFGNAGPESVLLNDGTGRFALSIERFPAGVVDITQDVTLGDIDGDRDLDLIVANEGGGPNRLYRNDGRGFFSVDTGAIPLRAEVEMTRNADLADIDHDGDLDLSFANVTFLGGFPQSRLFTNDGTGKFTDVTASQFVPLTVPATDLDFVDIDADGHLDLVMTSFAGLYRGFRNDGTGRFSDRSAEWFPRGAGGQGVEIEAADFNNDGKVDLYFANFIASQDQLLTAG